MRAALVSATLLAALAAASCADSAPEPDTTGAGIPPAVLSRLREAESEGHEEVRRAVAEVASGRAGVGSPSRQTVLTAWITLALDDGAVEEAHRAFGLLRSEHEGVPRYPDGSTTSADAVALGIAEAAVEEGRRRMEGPEPDRVAADRAFAVADRLLPEIESDPEVVASLARARAWAGLGTLEGVRPLLAAHDGARVLALVDDFTLGDTVVLSVLERWAAEGASGDVRVAVLPILTGHVRRGIRREPAPPEREVASLDERLAGRDVLREPGSLRPADAARLGLPAGHVGLLLADRSGRVVARLSGLALEPQALDEVVQRLATR